MENLSIHNKRVFTSVLTLANANELVSSVIHELAGDLIGNKIKGSNITSSIINILTQARIREYLKGVKKNDYE